MRTFRVLSALLHYPTPELKSQCSEAERILRGEGLLGDPHVANVCAIYSSTFTATAARAGRQW